MKIKIILLAVILFLLPNIALSYSNPGIDKKIKIVVTTSNLADLLEEICEDKIEVFTIIPVTMCPGSYDIDAKTIKEINKCNVVLYHHWQPWVKNLKYKTTKLGIVYRELKTRGNLMIPYINLVLVQVILPCFFIGLIRITSLGV